MFCLKIYIDVTGERGAVGTFAVEKIIERIQDRMRYGFPLIGIAPLSPLKLQDRNNTINLSFLE